MNLEDVDLDKFWTEWVAHWEQSALGDRFTMYEFSRWAFTALDVNHYPATDMLELWLTMGIVIKAKPYGYFINYN